MKKTVLLPILLLQALFLTAQFLPKSQATEHDLIFPDLAKTWDEAMPLGNAFIGALIWQKENALRLSLDKVDLWDLRPMANLDKKEFSYQWVYEQVMKKDYSPVQQLFDAPYEENAAPSKIPGAALEFPLSQAGAIKDIHLYLKNALCQVRFLSGMVFSSFVHADKPVGWFYVENADPSFLPDLKTPVYQDSSLENKGTSVTGLSLSSLGYTQGRILRSKNRLTYHQKGWGNFYYDVAVEWKWEGSNLVGAWSITSSMTKDKALHLVEMAMKEGLPEAYKEHVKFWNRFWSKSSIHIPDSVLEKQYFNEIYKLGSAARENSYPISLQAVWTADNGNLPPWKGDFHNDLNTQLSYWPVYAGNYLSEGMGYLNTLLSQVKTNERYTKKYFGKAGLDVPGVCTLTGEPMAGWIQYSLSPTVSAWLSEHFYLQWKFTADKKFLEEKAYPYLKKVSLFLENITIVKNGKRTLNISSSPEIFDNSLKAWFHDISNYDLSLISFAWKAAAEMADSLHLKKESLHWNSLFRNLPDFDLDSTGALTFAHGFPYAQSHRHFSNMMAIHPLGLIDWSHGVRDQNIIKASIKKLDDIGPSEWCGYSYSWLGNMKARAMDGNGAAKALRIFADCFCLRNTFHANGDQSKSGKSNFTYRPFTLEGNFAFAAGIQEMLLQSQTGILHIFPAIPDDWENLSFENLRAQGAFLISAQKKEGKLAYIKIISEKGGWLRIQNPFPSDKIKTNVKAYKIREHIIYMKTKPSEEIRITE